MSELMLLFVLWNIMVFFIYAIDKNKAVNGKWRISENALLLCSFLSGGVGAFLGMTFFRHKTKKMKFRILLPLAFVLSLGICIAIHRSGPNAADYNLISIIAGAGMAPYIRISPSEALAKIEAGNILIVDVRSQAEFETGHIEGAIVLPDSDIRGKAAQIIPSKDQIILVYCRSGARSQAAARTLIDMGYQQVYDFGGIINWPYEIVR